MPTPDDLHARAPVDRVAARVVYGKGTHFNPDKTVQTGDSALPIDVRPLTSLDRRNPNFTDLTGFSFGRFRVLGLADETHGRWVVRCSCGRYSLRTAKAIKNQANANDACEHCRHLMYLQRSYERRALKEAK